MGPPGLANIPRTLHGKPLKQAVLSAGNPKRYPAPIPRTGLAKGWQCRSGRWPCARPGVSGARGVAVSVEGASPGPVPGSGAAWVRWRSQGRANGAAPGLAWSDAAARPATGGRAGGRHRDRRGEARAQRRRPRLGGSSGAPGAPQQSTAGPSLSD